MRKVIIILLLITSLSGCAVVKRSVKIEPVEYVKQTDISILEVTKNQNITDEGFFIQKAEIEIITQEGKEKYLASLKYEKPGKYLMSIRSRSGIEGARIYISDDSLQINDRVHKKYYSGNAFYLKRKYGITPGLIPLLLGDLILDSTYNEKKDSCLGNSIKVRSYIKGAILNYEIDCSRKKVVLIQQSDNFNKEFINISFKKFFNVGSYQIAKMIEFKDIQYKIVIKIKVIKVESPWSGKIKFIPGKGYELIELI